jgi:hypothetical protein
MKVFVRIVTVVAAAMAVLVTIVAAGLYGYVELDAWRKARTAHASSFRAENSNDPQFF